MEDAAPLGLCAACERHRHYECIDCQSDHSTHICGCDCHGASTPPHGRGQR